MKHFYYLLLVFVISSTTANAADKPVAKFKGKPLAYWIERIEKVESDKEQKEAADAIMGFGVDAAPVVPRLLEMLDDRSEDFRGMICDVLIGIGPGAKSAVPTLIKMLQDKTARGPSQIIYVLAKISPDHKDLIPLLIAALEDPETESNAYWALRDQEPGLKENLRALIKLVEKTTPMNTSTAQCVIPLLRQLGPDAKQAVPALIKLIENADPMKSETAREAIAALPELGAAPKDLISVLTKALKQPDLVKAAVKALIALGVEAKDAVPAIREALQDARRRARTTEDTRSDVHELVAELYVFGPAGVPMLLDYLNEECRTDQNHVYVKGKLGGWSIQSGTRAPFQCTAAIALGEMGAAAKQAVPDLRKLLTAKDGLLQACAVDALWKIEKDVSVVPVLIAILKDNSFWTAPAASALGEIGPDAKAALPALRDALSKADSRVQQAIEDAIKKIDVERQQKE